MDDSFKKSKKRKKKKSCYLLTTSNSWVLDTVLSPISSPMISAYTNTLQLEGKILIKEELGVIRVDDGNLTSLQPPIDCQNYLKRAPIIKTGQEVGVEDILHIKFEDNGETPIEDMLKTVEGVEATNNDVNNNSNNHSAVSSRQYLDPHSSVFGLIKTVNGVVHYECDFCSKVFNQRWRIVAHRRVHTNERIFKCEHCTKSFSRRDTLLKHIRTAHGAHLLTTKPTNGKHKCDMCTKTYTSLQGLKCHIRKHGRGEIEPQEKKYSKTLSSERLIDKCDDEDDMEQIVKCDRCGKCFADEGWLLQHKKLECYYLVVDIVRNSRLGNA